MASFIFGAIAIPLVTVAPIGALALSAPPDSLTIEAMRRWEVPGVAYAVFESGAIRKVGTFGLRDVEAKLPVTRRSIFGLGSISKSFTVALLSRLAEQGRLDWASPPSRYIEGFRFAAHTTDRPISVGDLVSHRTGLPRHDALWYLEAFSGNQLVNRIRHLRRYASPGKTFEYSNLLIMLAGRVASAITGMRWAAAVQTVLVQPLEMTRTRIGYHAFLSSDERARGYYPADEGRIPIPVRNTDPIAPAAALYVDIDDAARWLAMLAGRGRLSKRRFLLQRSVEAMWTPQSIALGPATAPELAPVRYGNGFYITQYRGRKFVYHPGVIDGYAALIAILPETGFGFIVLTNRSGSNPVPAILAYAALDRHLGKQPIAWISRYASAAQRRATRARRKIARKKANALRRRTIAHDRPHSSGAYAGTYNHAAYGAIVLSAAGPNQLIGHMHKRDFKLERWGPLRWRLTETHWPLREGLTFAFTPGENAQMRSLTTPIADGPTYRHNPGPLRFNRIPQ